MQLNNGSKYPTIPCFILLGGRYYCKTITVRKDADEVYIFPCNRWFDSFNIIVHGAPYSLERRSTEDKRCTEDKEDTPNGLLNRNPKNNNLQPSSTLAKASTPASYIFFSLDMQSDSAPDAEPVDHLWRQDSINSNYKNRSKLATPNSEAEREWSSASGTHLDEESNGNISQLALIKQILSDPASNCPTSPDFYSSLKEQERAQITVSPLFSVGNVIQSASTGQAPSSHCQLTYPNTQMSGCPPEDQSSFFSDTTLDEEYLFSDTSDENDENISFYSESSSVGNRSEEACKAADMRDGASNPVQKSPTKASSEMAHIFQIALEAIQSEDQTKLKHMCEHHFFLLSSTDKEGRTLLHHAASRDNTAICQLLLENTVGMINIDRQDTYGKTALHYAVENGSSGTIKVLMNNRASAAIPDGYSKTGLDAALQKLQEM
eukprot:XP_017952646.1 PREDICTED: uncharacterized protein LOC108648772 [Xenopus tropicalis]